MAISYVKDAVPSSRSWFRKNHLNQFQAARLETIMARNYTDDENMQRGALSAPCSKIRPGSRDDAVRSSFAGIMAIL